MPANHSRMTTDERLVPGAAATAGIGDAALGPLRLEILRRVRPALAGAGVHRDGIHCHIVPESTRLRVHRDVPVPVSDAVRRAVAVRVLDAVRGAGQTYGPVHVSLDHRRARRPAGGHR